MLKSAVQKEDRNRDKCKKVLTVSKYNLNLFLIKLIRETYTSKYTIHI